MLIYESGEFISADSLKGGKKIIEARSQVLGVKNVVVKAGTNVLKGNGGLNEAVVVDLARQMSEMMARGIRVTYVSSGAIGVGQQDVSQEYELTKARKQALAAIGQPVLMHKYIDIFGHYKQKIAQLLIEEEDIKQHRGEVFDILYQDYNRIAVVNANDPVWGGEVTKDNDKLAAQIGTMIGADLIINLTDGEGMYDRHPEARGARLISLVNTLDDRLLAMATAETNGSGIGGMAAKMGMWEWYKNDYIIANGKRYGVLLEIIEGGDVGTYVRNNRVCQ